MSTLVHSFKATNQIIIPLLVKIDTSLSSGWKSLDWTWTSMIWKMSAGSQLCFSIYILHSPSFVHNNIQSQTHWSSRTFRKEHDADESGSGDNKPSVDFWLPDDKQHVKNLKFTHLTLSLLVHCQRFVSCFVFVSHPQYRRCGSSLCEEHLEAEQFILGETKPKPLTASFHKPSANNPGWLLAQIKLLIRYACVLYLLVLYLNLKSDGPTFILRLSSHEENRAHDNRTFRFGK